MRLFFFAFLLLAMACGNPTLIDGKNYSKACTVGSDCVAVFFGDQCTVCGCPNGALNASVKVTYEADRSAAIASCGPRAAVLCAPCQDVQPTCVAGICGL